MTTPDRRHQQRRREDIHPMEALNIAARWLLDVGGKDQLFVDGQPVEVTARVILPKESNDDQQHAD